MANILNSGPIFNEDLAFSIGSIVECTTCFGEVLTGEVMAFEYNSKILLLRLPSTAPTSNVACINLSFCTNIEPKSTPANESNKVDSLCYSTAKIDERLVSAKQARKNLIDASRSGASPDCISLYLSLSNTFGGSVTLEKFDNEPCILIQKSTKITPPYNVDCVQPVLNKTGTSGQKMINDAIDYPKQLVEKFWRAQNKDPYTLASLVTTTTPAAAASATTTTTISNVNDQGTVQQQSSKKLEISSTSQNSSSTNSSNSNNSSLNLTSNKNTIPNSNNNSNNVQSTGTSANLATDINSSSSSSANINSNNSKNSLNQTNLNQQKNIGSNNSNNQTSQRY